MAEREVELKSLLMKEESEKVGLKLNIQKTMIMASGPITSWQIDGETVETVTDFILGGSKITEDGDCSHEIKRCLLIGRKIMTKLDSIFGEGNGTPLQYSYLENPMDGGVWWATVHGVAKSRTRLSDFHFHFSLSCIGEGNGNPFHCSCLENPRDGGAWWVAVYGVAQSRTQLKRLSSSSSTLISTQAFFPPIYVLLFLFQGIF